MKHSRTYVFENTVFRKNDESANAIFKGPGQMEMGAAAEFGGSGENLNPEEMFVGAINGCLMNTFFYFTQRSHIEVLSYDSRARGVLEKQSDGFRFTHIEVRANVQLPENQDDEKVREAGRLAEKYCLVSRSVSCSVDYQLEIQK